MRWSLHVTDTAPGKLGAALGAARDHFFATSPPLTDELESMNSAIRASYNGPQEVTQSLVASRKRAMAERPHPDTPAMVAQINAAIDAVCAWAKRHDGPVNVSLYGHLDEQIQEQAPQSKQQVQTHGGRISINIDFPRVTPAFAIPAKGSAAEEELVDALSEALVSARK